MPTAPAATDLSAFNIAFRSQSRLFLTSQFVKMGVKRQDKKYTAFCGKGRQLSQESIAAFYLPFFLTKVLETIRTLPPNPALFCFLGMKGLVRNINTSIYKEILLHKNSQKSSLPQHPIPLENEKMASCHAAPRCWRDFLGNAHVTFTACCLSPGNKHLN